jgi:RimJ/RimL family protein N-acetyltransferase
MLKGSAVRLTEILPVDSDILYGWINDAEAVRFNAPFAPITRSQHDEWFASIGKNPSKALFAIRPLDSDTLLGTVQLIDIHPVHRTAELTIRIGKDTDRGKGYGTDALKLVIDTAFRDMNLVRVWLRVFSTNKRAIRAYEKAGFEKEGVMRKAVWINGSRLDEVVMAVLRQD